MENPLNPPENQIPLDKQNSLEDPLLDALERSIENPPGSMDPLVGDDQFMDGLARQLDQVEASIENNPHLQPEPTVTSEEGELNAQNDELTTDSLPEEQGPVETMDEPDGAIQNPPSSDSQDSDVSERKFKQPLPKPKRGGTGLKRWRLTFQRSIGGRTGDSISGKKSQPRFCPESRKLIDEQKCRSCEKYRHWPEGTYEEPRQCWYDWQANPPADESDDSDE